MFLRAPAKGRFVALDLGTKRFGVAVCDELQFTSRPLGAIETHGLEKTSQRNHRYSRRL